MAKEDKSQEAFDFMKQILRELQTMNTVNTQLARNTAQLVQQQGQLIQTLMSKGSQEQDTQYLLAQLTRQINELSEILTEEDVPQSYHAVPYHQQTFGQHLLSAGMEALGVPGTPPQSVQRRRRRRSG